jgi:hypothetical protein
METFDSTKRSLSELLNDISKGKIQLPDFQRGWVWDDNRIKGLLASVIKSFPISVVTLLETGDNVSFKTKPVEGAPAPEGVRPEYLILDGQQRLTSLYQAIVTNKVVKTKNAKGYEILRWYYIDMKKAMDPSVDLEEAIFSINEKKVITANLGRDIVLDLTTQEKEFENLMYPVCMIDEYSEWRWRFEKYWDYNPEKIRFLSEFERYVINNYSHYDVPVIEMKNENAKEAVCLLFEKVNTGGVSLTVFELLTATYAASGFDLKHDWEEIKARFSKAKVLKLTSNTDIIQAVTLLSTYKKRDEAQKSGVDPEKLPAVSAKRKNMLELRVDDYKVYRDVVVDGFLTAAKILVDNHIFSARDLPYTTQLIPMSAIIAVLGDSINNLGIKRRLMRWFWCGVFGELYGSANETRYAQDIQQVVDWVINDGNEPQTIYEAIFSPTRLNTLRSRNSAAYKGIYALLMDENTKDWLSGSKIDNMTYFDESIDIHHIFPRHWCEKNHIPRTDYDTIVNKTPLSKGTNIFVGGEAPSKYLVRLEKRAEATTEDINDLLCTHLINPSIIRTDDFYAFIADRKEQILKRIEQATGKSIVRDAAINSDEGMFAEEDITDDEE